MTVNRRTFVTGAAACATLAYSPLLRAQAKDLRIGLITPAIPGTARRWPSPRR